MEETCISVSYLICYYSVCVAVDVSVSGTSSQVSGCAERECPRKR